MAVKKNTRVARKRLHSRPIEKMFKQESPIKSKVKKRKALVIAQEIKFARLLANNDKKVRDKMLKNLTKWLTVRSESSFAFTEADFMRLWKGLFYCMWMSDKPLIQEELAESLGKIVHCFDSMETALLYTKCTLKTLAVEWFGIDRYRLDKFQMLVRRIIRQTFEMCKRRSWDEDWTKGVAKVFEELLLDPKASLGLSLHITEIYMEELAKIGGGKILPNRVTEFIRPFAIHLAAMEDERQIRHVMKHIFRYLIFQSDVGMDYMEKFEAWRQAGFPCANIDEMEKIELSDDEEVEEPDTDEGQDVEMEDNEAESSAPKALDPRAGRVDVELPQLPFDPSAIAEMIKQYKFHPKSTTKTRRQIMRLIREFSELANGNMPLGVKKVVLPRQKNPETNPKKAAYRLMEFEKELYSDKIRRKRKRKQIPTDDGDEEGFENVFAPLNEETGPENGFLDDQEDDFPTDVLDDEDAIAEPEETSEATVDVNKKSNKKKLSKKMKKSMSDISNSVVPKKKKKKNKQREETVPPEVTKPEKTLKIKSKKSKTKKLQSAINYINQKLLNRSGDDGGPVKAKKARQIVNGTWDVSVNDDPPATPPTPKVANPIAKKSPKSETNEIRHKPTSSNLSKHQMNKIPWLHPVLTKLEDEKPKLQAPIQSGAQSTSVAKKRVKIILRNNTAQHTSEYIRQLRQSPAIPYDANRKPLAGVLKPSPLSSPINPFYKKA